ncbi:hypothetical protein [Pedobacter agri]|uniref:hypothetical protein n=1 Tax=Pedobacter agri TaxID=454586 RepID=UPI00292E074B|nr:hypothetical protein [Pedobacter agri]
MDIRTHFCTAILVLFLSMPLFAQMEALSPYYKIKKKYENRKENDSTALALVNLYTQLAKSAEDYPKLVEGYQDGIFFSPNNKVRYADSAVYVAQLSKDKTLMCKAYLSRGTVYYFSYKRYKLALEDFLKAYEYAKKGNDKYVINKVAYRLAVIKSYLGFYDEALNLFKQTQNFFRKASESKLHVNLLYGNKRGYYNSLHQMSICYRNLGQQRTADSITEIGLSCTTADSDYQQEYGYFLKEKGISQYYRHKYIQSIATLKLARKQNAIVKDFAWVAVCYSYIGKSYMALGDSDQAFPYFQKVDSVFKRHQFLLPELRSNYEELIFYYKKNRDKDKELYYATQLIRADSIIREDFPYLSSKIYKEYDQRNLLDQKSTLQTKAIISYFLNGALMFAAILLLLFIIFRLKKEREIKQQYSGVEQKITSLTNTIDLQEHDKVKSDPKLDIEQKIVDELLQKLKAFENKAGFTESGLTLNKLATKFGTNQTYLSSIIKEYKGMNFSKYIGELRIGYITEKLHNDRKYLKYTFETLANECGIGSRNTLSALFLEVNGVKLSEFIKIRLQDVVKDINDDLD